MASTDPEPDFSLSYELRPDDLRDLLAIRPARKRRRARIAYATVVWALVGAVLTAVTVALDLPSVVKKNSSGAPSWMYVVDAVIWFFVINCGVIVWRLSPKRLARRRWRSKTEFHGRHHDEVGPDGITSTVPDGTRVITPWTSIDRIRETEHAFYLIGLRGGTRAALPKRGLRSPDLIPELREFLNRCVASSSHEGPPARAG